MSIKKNKSMVSRITAILLALLLLGSVLFLAIELVIELSADTKASEITNEEAQALVDDAIAKLPATTASGAKYVAQNVKATVLSVDYGINNDIIITCSYETIAAGSAMKQIANDLLCDMYNYYMSAGSSSLNATALQIEYTPKVKAALEGAKAVSGEVELTFYEQANGEKKLYFASETVDTLFGGLLSAQKNIGNIKTLSIDGKIVDIANMTTLRTGFLNIIAFKNYDKEVPQTAGWLLSAIDDFKKEFKRNFIEKDRYEYLLNGLGTTLGITGCAMLMGVLLGFLVAVVRVSYEKNGQFPILNGVCKIYLSIIRGTPVMVQLLIIYFVLLAPLQINKFVAAVICFGINSGAYVAEIVRGGIMSVDGGQIEAGRSLGLSYGTTMLNIVFPQAFKAALPSLANEFIVLLKETSVAFYIGVADLTQGGILIRSITYSNFMPLVAVAVVYWVLVVILTKLVAILERRLRQSER